MTARTAVRRKTLTIADLMSDDIEPLIPLWPDLGEGVLRLSESTTYAYADTGQLPVELVRVGRRRYARTRDVLAWLGLNGDGAKAATLTPLAGTHHSTSSDQ